MAFLQQFIDPGLKVSKSDTPETLSRKEVERLNELYAVASAALTIPRRLGGDADDAELAKDKQSCRRVMHVAEQCLKAWNTQVKPVTSSSISKLAAQVQWTRWLGEHKAYLDQRIRYIATWQYNFGAEHERWAKGALTRLANEQRWLEYALRDAPN